jgi:hypothetical protein
MTDTAQASTSQVSPGQTQADLSKSAQQKPDLKTANLPNGLDKEKKEAPEEKGQGLSEAQKEQIRKHKIKIDGEEKEVDDDELKRGYQLAKASNKRFEEASAKEKRAMALIELAKADPIKFLKHPDLGHDVKKLLEDALSAELEDELLPEHEREIRKLKRELEEERAEKKKAKEDADKAEYEKVKKHYSETIQTQILEALEKSNLPKSPLAVKRMAYYLHQAAEHKIPASPEDVVAMVRQDFIDEQKALFGGLDGDALMSILGEDTAEKVRKHTLTKIKNPNIPFERKTDDEKPKARNLNKKMGNDEWKEHIRKRNGLG